METFYKKYITKEIPREEVAAFDTGTYYHTRVLEPHLLDNECVVYEGVRRGKNWDAFKEANKGKAIVSPKQRDVAEKLAKATLDSPVFQSLFSGSTPEVSCFLTLAIDLNNGEIYSHDMEYALTENGFEYVGFSQHELTNPFHITLKVRSDIMGTHDAKEGYIVDLKSTTKNAKNSNTIRKSISQYSYDLSAALYLDIFSVVCCKDFKEFYWTFASKEIGNCQTYLASEKNILIGRAKWKKAVLEIAKAEANEWKLEDKVMVLEPEMYQLEWIRK
jgi:hypothetical protein